mmetsp:Transcript_2746/g.6602  ORF Transcript_2746/g.6602 Transcript_2746/m.6602 type:complete len:201 (-) Transcript_2746:400-1002(-)
MACRDLPNWISTSVPSERLERDLKGSLSGSSESSPEMEGADTRRHRAFPNWPCVSMRGRSVDMVDAARLLKARRPSCSSRDSVSWPSKIRATSEGSKRSVVSPVLVPTDRTRLSCHELARPWIRARRSGATRLMSRFGSRPCSGRKTARFEYSGFRLSWVATRFTSPESKRSTPKGTMCSWSIRPFSSTSPAMPKFKTKG